jgi:hypothetical protein
MPAIISYGSGVLNSTVYGEHQYALAALIEERTEQFEQKSQIKSIFKMKTSNRYIERYASLTSGEGFAPVGEGGEYVDDDFEEGYDKTINTETWKDQFVVTEEAIEDQQIDEIQKQAKKFTFLYDRTRETFAAAMLAGGLAGYCDFGRVTKKKRFNCTGADGLAYFHTAHTSKTGKTGTQCNLWANAFSPDALSLAQEAGHNITDDNGNLLCINYNTIVIGTDSDLWKAVITTVASDLDPETGNNAINVHAGLWNIIRWPYLDMYTGSRSAWFLCDSEANDTFDGALFIDRKPLTVRSIIEGNDNNVWKGRARFNAGFVDWRPWMLSYVTSGGTDITTKPWAA